MIINTVYDGDNVYEQPTELTNEQWIQTCTTDQLIKWLSKLSTFVYNCGENGNVPKVMYEEDWEYWLKQPHKEE